MHEKTTEAPTRSEIALQLHPDDPNHKPVKKRSSARPIGILILIAVLAGGFFIYRSTHKTHTTAAAGRRANPDINGSVQVALIPTQRQKLPDYQDGHGT